jgi:DNA repair photolyase
MVARARRWEPAFWVWWCKNPGLIEGWEIPWQRSALQLSVTGLGASPLEPGIPPAEEVWKCAARLIRLGLRPELIDWRYDPLLPGHNTNIATIEQQAHAARELGISTCITSFVSLYPKVMRRWPAAHPLATEPQQQAAFLSEMHDCLASFGIRLSVCTQPHLEPVAAPAACIDGRRYREILGLEFDERLAEGQRQGCLCTRSLDIGWYRICPGGCLYCYANPAPSP